MRVTRGYFNALIRSTKILEKNVFPGCSVYDLQYRWKSTLNLSESYLMGPGDVPLLGITLGQAFTRAADKYGDIEALVSCHQNIRKTFSQVEKEANELASGFVALGLKPGDRVGMWSPNCYEWYLTTAAVAKAGLILVNINPSYRPNELKYCLEMVSVKAIICAQKFKTSDYYKLLTSVIPELETSNAGSLQSKQLPHLKTVIMVSKGTPARGTYNFEEICKAGGSDKRQIVDNLQKKIQFDEPVNIQFTSGTTGQPKAALLSHHNIVNNAYFIGHRCQYDKKPSRICLSVPFYHCFGLVAGATAGVLHGSTNVLPSDGFDPKAIVKVLKEENVTACYGTPTMFVDILNEFKKNPFKTKTLRGGIVAGSCCPEELLLELNDTLNLKEMINMFGMTETSPVTFQCYPTNSISIRATTIGYPQNHVEVKIVDDDGRIVPIGVAGELAVRGYCNFLGYWNNEEKTKEIVSADRWLKTGDIVKISSDGYGQIVGRSKDMIIRGGENIYPAEIENFFMTHPDILETQVFGVPDKRMGEEMAMWVRLQDGSELTAEEVRSFAKEKIAHYKIPRYVLFKSEFPRTITGKIQKFLLRKQTIEELKL